MVTGVKFFKLLGREFCKP